MDDVLTGPLRPATPSADRITSLCVRARGWTQFQLPLIRVVK